MRNFSDKDAPHWIGLALDTNTSREHLCVAVEIDDGLIRVRTEGRLNSLVERFDLLPCACELEAHSDEGICH